jgi:hypothetical protein
MGGRDAVAEGRDGERHHAAVAVRYGAEILVVSARKARQLRLQPMAGRFEVGTTINPLHGELAEGG